MSKDSIYTGGSENMEDPVAVRATMVGKLLETAERYESIYQGFGRSWRMWREGRIDMKGNLTKKGTDVFIPTIVKLCNGMNDKKTKR